MTDDQEYFTSNDILKRFHITQMTLWRWLKKPEMQFPRPAKFGSRRYFKVRDVLAWEDGRTPEA